MTHSYTGRVTIITHREELTKSRHLATTATAAPAGLCPPRAGGWPTGSAARNAQWRKVPRYRRIGIREHEAKTLYPTHPTCGTTTAKTLNPAHHPTGGTTTL